MMCDSKSLSSEDIMPRVLRFVIILSGLAVFLPSFSFAQSQSASVSTVAGLPSAGPVAMAGLALPGLNATEETVPPTVPSLSEPAALPDPLGGSSEARVGIGVKVGFLEIGGEVAVRVLERMNVRAGFNAFSISHSLPTGGVNYNGSIHLQSVDALADFFLFRSFHVSGGALLYDGNNVKLTAAIPSGNTITIGGTQYTSDTTGAGHFGPLAGSGTVNFNKVAPEFLFGFGNLVPRGHRRWSINTEIGAAYQGAPKLALAFTGGACSGSPQSCVNAATDPTVQSNVSAQQVKVNNQA